MFNILLSGSSTNESTVLLLNLLILTIYKVNVGITNHISISRSTKESYYYVPACEQQLYLKEASI